LILALGIAIPAYWVSKRNNWGGTRKAGTWGTRLKAASRAKWALLTPVIILGGIYSGAFTPTESAAVASLYAFIIGAFVHKEIKINNVFSIFSQSAIMSVVAMFLIPFAVVLGKLLSSQQVPELITDSMSSFVDGKTMTILLVIAFLLFVGCFMDTLASIIVLTPLLYPMLSQYDISQYHFGIILIVCLGLGFVTPPLGGNLFIANQISKTSVQNVFVGALPTLGGMLVAALLIAFIPQISEIFL
jgi:C4-dicarboxylate transporter DctM subunit